MALDRYTRKDTLEQPGVVAGSGYRAVAEGWDNVGKAAGVVQDMAAREGLKQAEAAGKKEGERAVWVDPNTNKPQIVGTLPDGSRPYAAAYRQAAEARYQAELGLSSMTKAAEMGNANAGNPEAFRNAWQGYMNGITESVPEAIRPGTDLLLKELGVKQYYKMQQEDFDRTKNEAEVTTYNLVDAMERGVTDTLMTSGLAGGSPEYLSGERSKMASLLGDQVRLGATTPDKANARLQDFDFRTQRAMVTGEAVKMAKSGGAAKVQGFLDEYVRSPNGKVDDYRRNQISDYARGTVSTELAKAKAAQAAALEAAKKQVKDAQDTWWKGENFTADDQEVLRIAESTGDPSVIQDTKAALAARVTLKQFSVLSPQEQEAALAQVNNEDKNNSDSLKLRDALGTIYKDTLSAVKSHDTLELANNRGLVKVDPIDPAHPETMQKRAQDVAHVDSMMGAESHPLEPAEKDNFIRLFDGSDTDGKIALYGTMKTNLGHDLALRAMRQLGQERPAMSLAMAISDDEPEVARKILMGDLAMKADKNVLKPLASEMTFPAAFQAHIGSAVEGDDTLRNAIYEGAQAVYADNIKRNPGLDTDAEFTKAIDTVTGGIAEYNGFKTIVPKRGMSDSDFGDLIDSMDMPQFQRAAGGHKLVTLGGQEINSNLIHSKGTFDWVGDGQYILKLKINNSLYGQTVFTADEKGNLIKDKYGRPVPAELDLKPLVGGQ